MRKRAEVPPSATPSPVPPETAPDGTTAPNGTPPPPQVEFPTATPTTPEQAAKLDAAMKTLGVRLAMIPVDSIEEATRMAGEYFAAMNGTLAAPPSPERPRTASDVLALLNPPMAIGLAGAAVCLAYQVGKRAEMNGSADGTDDFRKADIFEWSEGEALAIVDTIAAVTAKIYNRSRGLDAPPSQS